jgi:serpin B
MAITKKISLIVVIILLVGAVGAAGIVLFLFPYEPNNPPNADDAGWTENGIQTLADANNQFAIDLYSELGKNEQKNEFYSPYSMFAALGMTYEGARGQTADEMKQVFHFPESNVLRPNFAAAYNEINKKGKEYRLSTGNALWVQQDYPLLQDYLTTVEGYYGGKAANVDFIRETEKSRQTINTFIEEQTNGKIKDLLEPGVLDASTRLVLTNAVYFKGTWEWEFDKSDTEDRDFTTNTGEVLQVPMMSMKPEEPRFNYVENDDLEILELPYKGDDISMLVILPKENIDALDLNKLYEWKREMQETKLDGIYLPKFKFETKYIMNDALSSIGMPTAFSGGADFSGITGNRDLYIAAVIHQAYVEVDEEGTEAAAATAVVMKETVIGPGAEPVIFNADHPFVFVIQQKSTGNILFMGKVVNPLESK